MFNIIKKGQVYHRLIALVTASFFFLSIFTSDILALSPESRLNPFFEKHGLGFKNVATVMLAAGQLRNMVINGNASQGNIMRLNQLFTGGEVVIEKDIRHGNLKCSGRPYEYAVFHFKKENKIINTLFIKDHSNLTVEELRELGVKTSEDKRHFIFSENIALRGVWFVNPDIGARLTVEDRKDPASPQDLLEQQTAKHTSAGPAPIINLDEFNDVDCGKILEWRRQLDIDRVYADLEDQLEYNIPQSPSEVFADRTMLYVPDKGYQKEKVAIYKRELPDAFGRGLRARAVHIAARPGEQHDHKLTGIFLYKGKPYKCGPRLCPYSHGHIVAGTGTLPQQLDKRGDGLKFFLILSRIYGPQYQGFFNAIAPTANFFHIQFVKNRMTIWDAKDIKKWPMKAELIEGDDIDKVVKKVLCIYDRYRSDTEGLEADCDLLFNFNEDKPESAKGRYRVIVIPRLKRHLKPLSKPFSDDTHFGTFGGVETGGSFMAADKTKWAFDALVADNGALYKRGMNEISWSGNATKNQLVRCIDNKIRDAPLKTGASNYIASNPSPEEALRCLVCYLSKQGVSGKKFKKYIPRLSSLYQDEFEELSDMCLAEMRKVLNTLDRGNFFLIKEFLPDQVYNSYSRLFRYRGQTAGDVFTRLGLTTRYKQQREDHGFINRSAFSDGKGSYFVDDYGMPGSWNVEIRTKGHLPNRLILRSVDAISKVINRSQYGVGAEIKVVIADNIDNARYNLAAVSIPEKAIFIARELCDKSRNEQEGIFAALLTPDVVADLASAGETGKVAIPPPAAKNPSDAIVVPLSMVEIGRARDYLHHKFNYRVQAFTQSLKERVSNVAFNPVETPEGYEEFIKGYEKTRQDVVVLSLYQLKRAEIEMLHKMIPRIKQINPDSFIVVEGPFTIHAKQALALSPEIDMMVRGEADALLWMLLRAKQKGKRLTRKAIDYILNIAEGGVFLKVGDRCYISNFNRTNVSNEVTLLKPQRRMTAIWYSERGCPHKCAFCRKDTGCSSQGRAVPAFQRINWMLDRLLLEVGPASKLNRARLKKILKLQAGNKAHMGRSSPVSLLPDTFIGRERVEIIIVSENALANKAVFLDFAGQIKSLGLQKYFKIKIADASVPVLMKGGKPDREFIRALKEAGVYFIGFGSENLSRTILADLRKGHNDDYPEGYTADEIIALNKVLIEEGFSPDSIRNNMLLNTPDSTLEEVKTGMLLMYAAPFNNSIYNYFSNGWGNARNSRMYVMEGSPWTAADTVRYSKSYEFAGKLDSPEFSGKDYVFTDHFYIARSTPEYLLRAEDSPMNYIDERIHPISSDFAYPHFYRYRLNSFFDRNFEESDIERARFAWRDPMQGREVNALAEIFDIYKGRFRQTGLETIKMIKAHMLSTESLSFIDYRDMLKGKRNLPDVLEGLGVYDLVAAGDRLMVPGNFHPEKAMKNFICARLLARLALLFDDLTDRDVLSEEDILFLKKVKSDFLDKASRYILPEPDLISDILTSGYMKDAKGGGFIESFNDIMGDAESDMADVYDNGLLSRMSYPDQQAFEYLRHLYTHKSNEELFNAIVDRMNERRLEFQTAIRELVCERMSMPGEPFSVGDYQQYVKSIKEYENIGIFGDNGLLKDLGSLDVDVLLLTIRSLLDIVSVENNPYIVRAIALNLKDLAAFGSAEKRFAFVVSVPVLLKIGHALGEHTDGDLLFGAPGSTLMLISGDMNNNTRAHIVAQGLPARYSSSPIVRETLADGNWENFCLDGGNLITTREIPKERKLMDVYTKKMMFKGNYSMFSHYLNRLTELSGRHRSRIKDEIRDFFNIIGKRPSVRYLMLLPERFLYIIPIIKMIKDDPGLKAMLMARGMEIFYGPLRILINMLDMNILADQLLYAGIFRRTNHMDPQNHLIAQSIIPLLAEQEAEREVSSAVWEDIQAAVAGAGILDELNEYLRQVWGIRDLNAIIEKKISLREAVIYLANFGIDKRFVDLYIKAREAYLGSVFMDRDFYTKQHYPAKKLISEMLGTKRAKKYLSEENRQTMAAAVMMLADEDGNLLPSQRELLHGYVRIFGFMRETAALKNNIQHKARPLLNILLRDTRAAGFFSNSNAASVDEANISGTSLLLSELVIRAFNGDKGLNYLAYNISQRTEETARLFKGRGIVDSMSTHNIWPEEDINAEFIGLFVNDPKREKRFMKFSDIAEAFKKKQDEITPDMDRKSLEAEITRYNQMVDGYIAENRLLRFVDDIPNLRYDPIFVKREMLKLLLRRDSEDPLVGALQASVLMDDIPTAIKINEADFPTRFTFRDEINRMFESMKASDLPASIKQLEIKLRYADLAFTHLARYMGRARQMVLSYVAISNAFVTGEMSDKLKQYLAGDITFGDLKRYFYNNYNCGFDSVSYARKKTILDAEANQLYIIYYRADGKCVVEFLSADGMVAALANSEPLVHDAAKKALGDLSDRSVLLQRFIDANNGIEDEYMREICRIARQLLDDTNNILSKAQGIEIDRINKEARERELSYFISGKQGSFNYEKDLLFDNFGALKQMLEGGTVVPPELEIHPTSSCNLSCNFCIGADKKPSRYFSLSEKDLFKIIEDVNRYNQETGREAKIKRIRFAGITGEPLLNPATAPAIKKAIDAGYEVDLVTNGVLLTDEIRQMLVNASRVHISLDAADRDTFSKMKGRDPEIFDRIVDNIKQLVELKKKNNAGLFITLGFVITSENHKELLSFAKFAKRLGVDNVRFRSPKGKASRAISAPQWRMVKSLYRQAKSLQDDGFRTVLTQNITESKPPPRSKCCPAHAFLPVIGSDGNVYPCCHVTHRMSFGFGNAKYKSLKYILESRGRQSVIARLDTSKQCDRCPPRAARINRFLDFLIRENKQDPGFLPWLESFVQKQKEADANYEKPLRRDDKNQQLSGMDHTTRSLNNAGAMAERGVPQMQGASKADNARTEDADTSIAVLEETRENPAERDEVNLSWQGAGPVGAAGAVSKANIMEAKVEANRIHDGNLKFTAAIPDKTIVCHIVSDSILPDMQLKEGVLNRLATKMRDPKFSEKIVALSVKDPNNTDQFMEKLSELKKRIEDEYQGYTIQFDVACPREDLVEKVQKEGLQALAFKREGEGEIIQIEGIILALRALRTGSAANLISAYKTITGNDYATDRTDINELARMMLFILPVRKIDVNQLGIINRLIEENIRQAA